MYVPINPTKTNIIINSRFYRIFLLKRKKEAKIDYYGRNTNHGCLRLNVIKRAPFDVN